MKFNFDKLGVLELLKEETFWGSRVHPEMEKEMYDKLNNLDENLSIFPDYKEIPFYYISKTICDKFTNNKLANKLWNLGMEVKDGFGCIIMNNKMQFLYNIRGLVNADNEHVKWFIIINFLQDAFVSCLTGYYKKNTAGTGLDMYYLKDHSVSMFDPDTEMYPNPLYTVILNLMFLQYAEVETKILTGSGAYRKCVVDNEKHINELNVPIQIIDSTWFTTLIKSDGFNVDGHFRLQPIGEGRKDRKLIWINDFQKNGYTRKAKILTQNED